MRRTAFLTALVASAVLALPAAAADSAMMAMFKDMCVGTRAAMAPSLAKADAKGWTARILLHQKETGLTMVGYAIPRL